MSTMAAQLDELHRLLLALQEVRDQLERGPRQIQARSQLALQAQKELEDQQALLKQLRASADRKSLDLKSHEAKLADLRSKLNAASSNREYDIIRGQIDADTVAKSVLEDEILEILEKIDRTQAAIAGGGEKVKKTEADKEKFREQFDAAAGNLRERAAALDAQIRGAESGLTGDLLDRYRRLVEAHGAAALAQVQGGVCNNCYVNVTPQAKVQLNSGRVLFCGSCGRMLYLPSQP